MSKRFLTSTIVLLLIVTIGVCDEQSIPPSRSVTDRYRIVTSTIFRYNNTNCPYQFPLYDNRRISVCLNSTVIDIRQFLNNKPTIKGLNMSKVDWLRLVNLIPYINATF